MPDLLILLTYIPAALALNLTPGADMLFCLGQGVRSGPRSAWAASAGISLGGMVHVFVAGMGLGAVIAAVPWAFDVIRWIGVAYLLYLAAKTLRGASPDAPEPQAVARAFRTGLMVNLTNPKVILFVLAFVPQFVDPTKPVLAQFMVFGMVMGIGGFFINGGVGAFAGTIGKRVARGSRALDYVASGVFVALAAKLAVLERA
ncbi:LysE family transporter [Pseudosulfitobacter sp. SM2401]|uniref:LysE family translocator n=1 Tax=Pseudosulfitobacter sp. SM2401 TaxID=3350098 RepID=UPI0036F38B27